MVKINDWLRKQSFMTAKPQATDIFISSQFFMRLKSDGIRLIIVDEPTAALDAKAESNILKRLKEAQGKQTMLVLTHRFGNLTIDADLIL